MSSELLTAIISSLITALCTFLITLFAIKVQRGRKVIEYKISSMPLLRFKPMGGTLSIAVDKFILTNKATDKGISYPINNAYGFQVDLINVGSDDIGKPNIEITLDSTAKVVAYETQPAPRPGYDVNIQRDNLQPNILRILVPFINRGEQVIIRLISTENTTKKCKVGVLGLGIHARPSHPDRKFFLATMLPLILITLIALLLTIIPDSIIIYIGGHYVKSDRAMLPDWLDLTLYLSLIFFTLLVLINTFKRMFQSMKRGEIEWDDNEIKLTFKSFLSRFFSSDN